jgi:23S rRNA (adenine2030-N6)-methyltransferase
MRKTLVAELLVHADDSPLRLNGCGMVIVNAPWKFDGQLRDLLPLLLKSMSREPAGSARVDWLVRD